MIRGAFTGGANYNNQSGTVDDYIGKADATVTVTAYSVTYDANPHTATYTITGVGTDTGGGGQQHQRERHDAHRGGDLQRRSLELQRWRQLQQPERHG